MGGGFFCYPAMVGDPWLNEIREKAEFGRLVAQAEEQHRAAAEEFARLDGNRILGLRPS